LSRSHVVGGLVALILVARNAVRACFVRSLCRPLVSHYQKMHAYLRCRCGFSFAVRRSPRL
jgi:hypothetical protein